MDEYSLERALAEIQRSMGRIEGTLDSIRNDVMVAHSSILLLEARTTTLETLKFKLMGGAAVLATFVTAFISLIIAYVSGWFQHKP